MYVFVAEKNVTFILANVPFYMNLYSPQRPQADNNKMQQQEKRKTHSAVHKYMVVIIFLLSNGARAEAPLETPLSRSTSEVQCSVS